MLFKTNKTIPENNTPNIVLSFLVTFGLSFMVTSSNKLSGVFIFPRWFTEFAAQLEN